MDRFSEDGDMECKVDNPQGTTPAYYLYKVKSYQAV